MKLVSIIPVIVFLYANFSFSSDECTRSYRNISQKSESILIKPGATERFFKRKFKDFARLSSEDFSMLKIVLKKDPKKGIEKLWDCKHQTVFHALLFQENCSDNNIFKTFCKSVESVSNEKYKCLSLYLSKTDAFTLLKKIEQDCTRKKYVEFLIAEEYFSREEAIKHNLVSNKKKKVHFPEGWQ